MSLNSTSLFILVTTLADVYQQHTIELLDKTLKDTIINILVLINKIDLRLIAEWDKFKSQDEDDDEPVNDGWADPNTATANRAVVSPTGNFSANDTVKQLIERPKRELIEGLTVDQTERANRVTIIPVILHDFPESSSTYADLRAFARREPTF
ncbi:unnamed protein product, partial [Rotaria socialis]